MKRDKISVGDKIKIKRKKFEVVKIGKDVWVGKKGKIREYEEFELRELNQKTLLPKAKIDWWLDNNRIIFHDVLELKEKDIDRIK